MMGNIAKLTDLGRSLVPYLTWRDERTSLVLLQVTVVSGLLLAFISPYIPWRYVFLVSGETILLVGHPVVQKLVREAAPIVLSKSKRWSVRVERLVEEDALPDDELEGEIDIVERYDVESRTPDGQWVQDTVVGGELPEDSAGGRWRWIQRGDWQVDAVAEWAEGKVDDGELGIPSGFPFAYRVVRSGLRLPRYRRDQIGDAQGERIADSETEVDSTSSQASCLVVLSRVVCIRICKACWRERSLESARRSKLRRAKSGRLLTSSTSRWLQRREGSVSAARAPPTARPSSPIPCSRSRRRRRLSRERGLREPTRQTPPQRPRAVQLH